MFLSRYWNTISKTIPDKLYLEWQFKHVYKRKLNIDFPATYADKLAYLKTHDRNTQLAKLVDKYVVREYVKDKIGSEYLIPLIGVYNSVNKIPWNELPEKYVLKCTHDSGSIIFHNSNDDFDVVTACAILNKHMHRNLYWYSREYPYRDVPPRIVCEEMLQDNGHIPFDYKFMCFSGEPKYIVYDQDRFGDHHRDIYDIDWVKQDISTDHYQSQCIADRPKCLEKMTSLAKTLSEGFKHVRIDFYCIDGQIYFGEITFFPWGGVIWFKPDEWNYIWGDLIKLDF